ncbi:MAG: hypothetical protein P1S46_09405 [bacterium]|nr:hypothetical protein [bacterium]
MMKIRNVTTCTMISVALSFVIGMPFYSLAADNSFQLGEAETLLEKKEYEQAVAMLEPMLEEESGNGEKARVHFLLGRVLYEKAFAFINANRVDGKVKFKDIAPSQVTELKSAAGHFLQVVEMDPDGNLVPDAYFMLGKVWDYDCLQKFVKSKEAYGKAAEMRPDTEISKEAASCVERLEGYFSSHESSH